MTRLADVIRVGRRAVRAVNLEHDLGAHSPLDGYTVGPHIAETLRRVAAGLQEGPRDRAWSITGPYGVGKSAFAHFTAALLGPQNEPGHLAAAALLERVDPQLEATLRYAREETGAGPQGLLLAVAVANRAPLASTFSRAFGRAAATLPKRARRDVDELLGSLTGDDPAGARGALIAAFDRLCAQRPVLLVVDEFGKALEHAAARPDDSDLALLQDLAERCSNSDRPAGVLLTLQHLAFDDYMSGVPEARRREWRKVQGRFHDVAFLGGAEHSRRVLVGSLERTGRLPARLTKSAAEAASALVAAAPDSAEARTVALTAAETYPLHPLATAILPDLTARFGQHDRSLLGFLSAEGPDALGGFLRARSTDERPVPFVRVTHLYAHFVRTSSFDSAGPQGARLREIRAAVEQAPGLSRVERDVAETIGLLNLVSPRLGLAASPAVVEEAVAGPGPAARQRAEVQEALRSLERRGILTYRGFAGEYRIWAGSDFDVDAALAVARSGFAAAGADAEGLIDEVARARPPRGVVAARHSLERHVLRYFDAAYVFDAVPEVVRTERPDADGLVLWVLSSRRPPRRVAAETADGQPLVVVWSTHGAAVWEAAAEHAAAETVLQQSGELDDDPVARRELRHRAAAAHATLAERLDAAFERRRDGVEVYVRGSRAKAAGARALSRLVSALCDERYDQCPVIPNEMLNRRELSSQGAKARRELLNRMFDAEDRQLLGIAGFGPDRAMYDAMLGGTGLHARRDGDERWSFGPPFEEDPLTPAWREVQAFFDDSEESPHPLSDLYARLADPPYGMKHGPIPLLLAAALLHRSEDIFVYEAGSFVPVVTAAHVERLLKDPARFGVKRAAALQVREEVFRELRRLLSAPDWEVDPALRNRTTLAVARPMLATAKSLPKYVRETRRLARETLAVRDALLKASDPDRLLLHDLPRACGVDPFAGDDVDGKRLRAFTTRLRAALTELQAAYPALLEDIERLARIAFETPSGRPLREDLRARAAHLKLHVIEPRMLAFLELASNEDLSGREWTEAIVINLVAKPPASWSDGDRTVFEAALAERAAWFARLEALRFGPHREDDIEYVSRRVSVTSPAGDHRDEVVVVKRATTDALEAIVAEALERAIAAAGSSGDRALLAVIAERVLPATSDTRSSARADTA